MSTSNKDLEQAIDETINSSELLQGTGSYIFDLLTLGPIKDSLSLGNNWSWTFANSTLSDAWIEQFSSFNSTWAAWYAAAKNVYSNFNWTSSSDWANAGSLILSALGLSAGQGLDTIETTIGQGLGLLTNEEVVNQITNVLSSVEGAVGTLFDASVNVSSSLNDNLNSILSNLGGDSVILSVISKGLALFSNSALSNYEDGISETSFGYLMENSWSKSPNSFLATFSSGSSIYSVSINSSTPFDPGENQNNIYGNMMLGAPPIFTHITDPRNRSLINTFLQDARFLSLTPGYPKYNGSNYLMSTNDDALHQTQTGESMLAYLLRNGIDKTFAEKDRRYYTFKTDYEDYYAYLETMLNTLWIKMGLGTESNTKYNIYTFFNILQNGKINTNGSDKLLDRYRTSFGFYVNPDGVLTESLNSQMTSFGSGIASEVNSSSENYQSINYLTGMGTGGSARNASRIMANTLTMKDNLLNFINEAASNTISTIKDMSSGLSSAIGIAIKLPFSILSDTSKFLRERDSGAVLQSFATTNGMKVVYPELWNDSSFSKSININFEFISPYGDPLSIFQYVMAPFAALLCFAMPRQAADNGFVSPFFVRADIPGLFSVDLGLITDFTWTRGGNQNLWTKDGLPRAISGSFTISDLYPFLAMTKRFSFLSSNPNYTVFLDSLAGFHSVYSSDNDSGLNEYWLKMINRINGESNDSGLWNKFSKTENEIHKSYANTERPKRTNVNNSSVTWLRGVN